MMCLVKHMNFTFIYNEGGNDIKSWCIMDTTSENRKQELLKDFNYIIFVIAYC